jgi:hypothetical protein
MKPSDKKAQIAEQKELYRSLQKHAQGNRRVQEIIEELERILRKKKEEHE